MSKTIIVYKKSKSRCYINKCYNLPEGVVLNKFSDVILQNFSPQQTLKTDGDYMMVCKININDKGKPTVVVSMNKEINNVDEQIKQLDKMGK